MKISNILFESFECVKINGILRNLTNDEMKVYKKTKESKKIYKEDLPEFLQTVATSMVVKGLLRRKKEKETGKLYYSTVGRNGKLKSADLTEVAPPDKDSETWIRKNKKKFKDRYGDGYEKYLYGKAWKNYNGKKRLKESYSQDEDNIYLEVYNFLSKELENNNNVNDIMRRFIDNNFFDANIGNNEYSDKIESFGDHARECAVENGNFDVYDEDEIDYDATVDNINSNTYGYLWDRYYYDSSANDIFEDMYKCLIENVGTKEESDEVNEPTWDGDESYNSNISVNNEIKSDEMNNEEMNIDDDTKEIIEFLKKLCSERDYGDDDTKNDILDKLGEYSESYNSPRDYDNLYTRLRDEIYDAARESDDFNVYERTYNSDATWDAVYQESVYDLLYYVSDNKIKNFLYEIYEICKEEVDNISVSEEPETTGEEFNETYKMF